MNPPREGPDKGNKVPYGGVQAYFFIVVAKSVKSFNFSFVVI